MTRSVRKKRTTAFQVGDRVRVRLAGRDLLAIVIEDRGNLGPGGSRLVRVELNAKNGANEEREQFEVPTQELVPA